MKLHLPTTLRAALLAVVAAGSAAYGSTTYGDLTTPDYFKANEHVYNTGKGTFYLETPSCDLNLTLTLNLNKLNDFQTVHDYANGGYYSPFVTWTYNNNPGSNYGMADVARGYSNVNYDSGFTGYWAGSPWKVTDYKVTTETLQSYADTDGNVTLTINNTPNGTTNNVVVTATNKAGTVQTLYSADGLRSQNYTSQHITSFTVNMNYVTSVTLNTDSTLDSSSFTPPKDYSIPFESERTDGSTVGRVLFLGDSITHGVQDMSHRWGIFKTLVDNGIENEFAGPLSGYHSDPLNGDYNGNYSSSQYGGETFDNAHYAQSSGRTHNMLTASGSVNALGNSTGVNYGGVSSVKVGKEYNADTYVMMMGTNDILSDGAYNDTNMPKVTERLLGVGEVQNGKWVNGDVTSALIGALGTTPSTEAYSGKWGTMGKIIDNMKMGEGDTMYIVSVPTWGEGRTGLNGAAPYVQAYNEKLKLWVDSYNESHTGTVKYVDVNRGLVNVTRNGQFLAPDAFFRTTGNDYIHPNEQGALIVAGNLAQGMGIGGRTAGLHRADSSTEGTVWKAANSDSYTLNAGQFMTIGSGSFTAANGYTVDFSAVFGDGAENGWLGTGNALNITIGDGAHTGTLSLSEGYISWGSKVLFCQDNSLTDNDSLRIAYHTGDAENNVNSGYYVWLGDMLIGQALTAGTGSQNGITLRSVGATSTVSHLTYSNTAYAPTTTGMYNEQFAYFAPMSDTPEPTPADVHDNPSAIISSGVNWSTATETSAQKGVTAASGFTDGKATLDMKYTDGWMAASAVTATGSIEAKVEGITTGATVFAAQAGTLTGNVTLELKDATVNNGAYGGISGAVAGSFGNASVTGTFSAFVNNTTVKGDMVGGAINGNGSVGAVNFVVNTGTVEGSIYGGSKTAGTVGTGSGTAVSITVNGGTVEGNINGGGTAGTVNGNTEITINGGIIKRNIEGGTLAAGKTSTVTINGNKAAIGGSITADKVNLCGVDNSSMDDGFDKYKGTITAANMDLDAYTADAVGATLNVSGTLAAKNNTDTTVSKAATVGTLSVDAGSKLAFDGKLTLTNGLALNKSGASVTFNNGLAVTTGIATNNRYDMVLSNGAEATINCGYTANRLLASCAGTTLNFGENARVTVDGIYNSSTNNNSNGTLNVADGAEVVSNGTVRANTMNLNGSLTVKGTFGANTLNMSGGTLNANADAGITTLKVTGEEKATLSGRTNVTTLTVDGSFLDIAGGTHTIGTLEGNDSVAREGVVTIKDDAAVSAGTLKVGARGQRYLVEDGSSLAITGNNLKVEAASGDAPAALYTTYAKANTQYTYGAGNGNFVIENAKVTLTDAVTVGNKLVNAEVVADAEGKTVTLNNSGNTLTKLNAAKGDFSLQNINGETGISLEDLVIGNSRAVTALVNGTSVAADESNVAKVLVTGELNAMTGAELNANLTMATGSTLKVAAGGLAMGCTLTLNEGINLGDEQLTALYDTHYLTLFTGVDAITLADNGITADALNVDAAPYFNIPTATADAAPQAYRLVYSGVGNGGVVSLTVVPEPATATLSLLALAALAARRRRK